MTNQQKLTRLGLRILGRNISNDYHHVHTQLCAVGRAGIALDCEDREAFSRMIETASNLGREDDFTFTGE